MDGNDNFAISDIVISKCNLGGISVAKQTFLKGAFILVLASITVKVLGFIYQIMIVRLVGTEGIGIFNMVYPLYITVFVLTTAGIPTALSKYVAEETARNKEYEAEKVLGMALVLVIFLSTVGALFLILASPRLIRLLYTDPRVIPSFLVITPTLLLATVSSCIRGYFQGLQDMRPTAINQLVEQVIRFLSGLALVYFLTPFGLTWATVGLAGGVLLSEIGGLVYVWRIYIKRTPASYLLLRPSLPVARKLFSFGVPLTVTRIVSTLSAAIEGSLIPHLLMKSGVTLTTATSLYGELTGVAFTLLNIPSTLTFSLATTLVPAISEAHGRRQNSLMAQRTSDAIGITLLAGIPSAIILFYWGNDLAGLLFKAKNAGLILKYLALGSIFLYICQTTSGILQGTGYVKTVFVTNLISCLIRLGGIVYLGGQFQAGLEGVAFSYVAGFFVLAVLNLIIIKIKTGFTLEKVIYLRLALAGLALVKLLQLTAPLIQGNLFYLILLTLGNAFLFFLILYVTGDKYSRLVLQQIKK